MAGASIGAFNSLALISRWPHLFRSAICMSGTFDIEQLIGGFTTDLFYSSRCTSYQGLEGRTWTAYASGSVYPPSGSGAWEDVGESWRAAEVLGTKVCPTGSTTGAPTSITTGRPDGRCSPNYVQQAAGSPSSGDRSTRTGTAGGNVSEATRVGVRADPVSPTRSWIGERAPLDRPRPLRRQAQIH